MQQKDANIDCEMRSGVVADVEELRQQALSECAAKTAGLTASSVFYVEHGTRLPGSELMYHNRYVLVRVGRGFGVCSVAPGTDTGGITRLSGTVVTELLHHSVAAVWVATLDAYLSNKRPFHQDSTSARVSLPEGTSVERATKRDEAILSLARLKTGQSVGLVGVVTPLVEGIVKAGCTPLLADRALSSCLGFEVHAEGETVAEQSDCVIATGMTLVDGSFDRIRQICIRRGIGLVMYAQSGAAIIREFLGHGVQALNAEPFPCSQFSASETYLYQYYVDDFIEH